MVGTHWPESYWILVICEQHLFPELVFFFFFVGAPLFHCGALALFYLPM